MPQELISKFYLLMLEDDLLDSPKIKEGISDITLIYSRPGWVKLKEIFAEGAKTRFCRMFPWHIWRLHYPFTHPSTGSGPTLVNHP